MKKYKKIDNNEYAKKEFKMSEYFSTLKISDCRMRLRAKLGMIHTIRDNFRNNKKYKQENYQCPDCLALGIPGQIDDQDHVLTSSCIANSDLRSCLNLDQDQDICDIFRDLIDRRMERFGE